MKLYVFAGAFSITAQAAVWNPTTDPAPPLQPKECGYTYTGLGTYESVGGESFNNFDLVGSQFWSFAGQSTSSVVGGSNGQPYMQYASSNFTTGENFVINWQLGTCTSGTVEGGSPYMGYDYYTNLIEGYAAMNVTVLFSQLSNFTALGTDFGPCYQYQVLVPWDFPPPTPPRNLTYTAVFQIETGYLILFALTGTEYCCPSLGTCVDFTPNCTDGTSALLTYVDSSSYYTDYKIYTPSSWSSEFFSINPSCPFATDTSDNNTDTSDNNTDTSNNSNGNCDDEHKQLVIAWVLAGIFIGVVVITAAYLGLQRSPSVPCFKKSGLLGRDGVSMSSGYPVTHYVLICLSLCTHLPLTIYLEL